MFEIKQGECVGQTNKLLWNIWQELKKLAESKPEIDKKPDKKPNK